jgi:ketosteroid isomerase-like protein
VASWVARDFVNEHTAAGGVSRHGRAEYRAALDTFLADFADLHYAVESLIVDGPNCAVPYRMTALMKGRPLDIRGVFVFVVNADGLIARRTDYWDSGNV